MASIIEASRKLAAANLKRCPVCEALNAASNAECFVCRWHGEFDHDAKAIEEGLKQLLNRCPEIKSVNKKMPAKAPRRRSRLTGLLRRLVKRPLDLSV